MPLNDIVMEVMTRKSNGQKASLLSEEELRVSCARTGEKSLSTRKLPAYKLGAGHGNAYFTKREAECMLWLLKGKTINSTATLLELSPRTVEYYIKNMKAKTGCRTKFELIDLVYASEFTGPDLES